MCEEQVLGDGKGNFQGSGSGGLHLFLIIGEPDVEVAGEPSRKIHEQLGEAELRVDMVAVASAGQAGEDGGGSTAAWIADEQSVRWPSFSPAFSSA
jgi:hypothetical protein